MSSKQIEGIPDGWELVAFREASEGEYFLNNEGKIEKWTLGRKSCVRLAIIRKIEKPKKFRAFKTLAEAEPFFDRKLKYKQHDNAILRIGFMSRIGVEIGRYIYSYKEAYEALECIDGTPFGIEVTE